MSAIEALYIFDEHNALIFDHVYHGRPPTSATLLTHYLQHAAPRPSVIHILSTNPPTILFSIIQDNLLFFSPASNDIDPLMVLEFLHRIADALEEFLGSPLLASKITTNYDILAQIVAEMADGGIICQGEANALREVVETGPGVFKNLLGNVGLPGTSPSLTAPGVGNTAFSRTTSALQPAQSSQGSAVPWRRSNVRYTSNEMYVDIVEALTITLAPSGRALAAFAHGSIAFTSKVSGVPDLLLTLSPGNKGGGMGTRGDRLRGIMERVVFHPCVRLSRWKSEGVISFVPPDGKFALCGYEVDLLGPDPDYTLASSNRSSASSVDLPAHIDLTTGLGPTGSEFEVRITTPTSPGAPAPRSAATASLQSHLSGFRPAGTTGGPPTTDPSTNRNSTTNLEDVTAHIALPPAVRQVRDLRAARGEAQWLAADRVVEWRVSARDLALGPAVLRCALVGEAAEEQDHGEAGANGFAGGMAATTYDYDEEENDGSRQQRKDEVEGRKVNGGTGSTAQHADRAKELMPTSATLSFGVKGWLASGLKVEGLVLDAKKSRGLGADLKPYKGVKYLTVSRKGIELRC